MKNIVKITFLIFSILLTINPRNTCLAEEASGKTSLITLYLGETRPFPINNPTRVVISKPNIADVTTISKDEMLITAKAAGTTDLVWWDSFGRHQLQLEVFAEDMGLIKERIDNILKELNFPNVFTRSMNSEGKVLLLGSVKTPQDRERIAIALKKLKDKIVDLIQVKEEEAMVEIGVQILELNKDATTTLGFSWPSSISLTEKGTPAISDSGTKWGTLFKVLNVNRAAFTWTLDALVQEGKARILSQPRLACQSGKEAELLVGGEKPILTTTVAATTGAQGTNVQYKDFGIKLKIKPTVTEKKQIKLALNVEVSEVGTAEILGSASSPTARAYPLTKRNASTELFLNDGQTMAIGGLIKQKAEEDIRKTPFLGDVPILGLLFRRKSSKAGGGQGERGDTELFITLSPNIIKQEVTPKEKEEVKLETPAVPKEEVNSEAPAVPKEEEPQYEIQPQPEVKLLSPTKPEIEIGGAGVFPKGIITKESLKPKAEVKAKKAPLKKKVAKVKVSLKEAPTEEVFKAESPAPTPIKEEPKVTTSLKEVVSKLKEKETKVEIAFVDVDGLRDQALSAYLAAIAQRIRDNLVYPWLARQMNWQGSLRLGMHLNYTGQLLEVAIKQPSGCTLLDDDAISTVKKVAPYPPFPPEINQKELRIDLPIIYKIE